MLAWASGGQLLAAIAATQLIRWPHALAHNSPKRAPTTKSKNLKRQCVGQSSTVPIQKSEILWESLDTDLGLPQALTTSMAEHSLTHVYMCPSRVREEPCFHAVRAPTKRVSVAAYPATA